MTEEDCPIIPASAQNNININFILKCLYDKIKNVQKHKLASKTEHKNENTLGAIVRTFDINLPEEFNEKNKLSGVVIGGSIITGSVNIGDTITILPNHIQTRIINIKYEQYDMYSAGEGGLVAIQTDLAPGYCDAIAGTIFTKTIDSSFVKYDEGELIQFTLKKINKIHIHNGDIITFQCLTQNFNVTVVNKDKKDFTCRIMTPVYIPNNYCIIVLVNDKIYGYSLESTINRPPIDLIAWGKFSYLHMLEHAKNEYTSSSVKLKAPITQFINKVTKIVNFLEICDSLKCNDNAKRMQLAKFIEEELSLKSWSINADNQLLIKGKIHTSSIQTSMIKFAKKNGAIDAKIYAQKLRK